MPKHVNASANRRQADAKRFNLLEAILEGKLEEKMIY